MVTTWLWTELTVWVELKLVEKLISLKSFITMMSQTQKEQLNLQKDLYHKMVLNLCLGHIVQV